MKKKILYLFFVAVIIVSGVILFIEYNKEPEEPEIYQPTPSEIEVSDSDMEEKLIEKVNVKMAPDVDLDAERKKYNNPYIVGRLEIPNLFNVLVAQSDASDDDFYLSHDISRKHDIRGTEFLDYRVTPTSKQLNIYGHNTRDPKIKVAFLKLEQFLDKSYFDDNPYIIFQHDGGKNIYKIISIKEVQSRESAEHMIVNKKGEDFVKHVKAMTTDSTITVNGEKKVEKVKNYRSVSYDENSEILVLQTCSHSNSFKDPLYIVVAVKIAYE